mmetsp:Transcript_7614/g.13795  ORF Transcript_7614/g.13795 Transcript_7614/m.13795 type:complete len:234 (-) Transcript_7614:472-1173(-)
MHWLYYSPVLTTPAHIAVCFLYQIQKLIQHTLINMHHFRPQTKPSILDTFSRNNFLNKVQTQTLIHQYRAVPSGVRNTHRRLLLICDFLHHCTNGSTSCKHQVIPVHSTERLTHESTATNDCDVFALKTLFNHRLNQFETLWCIFIRFQNHTVSRKYCICQVIIQNTERIVQCTKYSDNSKRFKRNHFVQIIPMIVKQKVGYRMRNGELMRRRQFLNEKVNARYCVSENGRQQ